MTRVDEAQGWVPSPARELNLHRYTVHTPVDARRPDMKIWHDLRDKLGLQATLEMWYDFADKAVWY